MLVQTQAIIGEFLAAGAPSVTISRVLQRTIESRRD